MKVSLNTLKFINQQYGSAGDPAPEGLEALLKVIGERLGAVEDVVPYGERFKEVLVVRVISCQDHPNAERLHICKIDDGGKVQDVERDEQGHVQIVCAAPNVRADMWATWLPPGSTVPVTIGTPDPFVLDARALRGVASNGMLASPRELTIGDSHDRILEIADTDGDISVGMEFVDVQHLRDDVVIDMENKMFTHRPDGFSWLGIARELEGIQHRPYKSPSWYRMDPDVPGIEAEELPLEVRNELPELAPRFTAITLRGVEVKVSPLWLQLDLARVGLRPINNIVDYANFFMLETGQPIHAYDYDKVKALCDAGHAVLGVRHPRPGEKLTLLNGKEITPRDEAILITTDKTVIGLAGVMGGGDTEVDEHTKNVIIESANFDMYSVRRTSMAHGVFTDAVTRFNKGQSPLQTKTALAKIVAEIRQYAGGKVASQLIDDNHVPDDAMQRGSVHPPVTLTAELVNSRLGVQLPLDEMAQLLKNVEFDVQTTPDALTVTAPFWRTDIELPEDVIEEIGRLYGYGQIPVQLPVRTITPAQRDSRLELKAKVRDVLADAGANELLTYSFVHGNLLDKVGQGREQAFELGNALSPDLQFYRMSLTPSLLERVHPNIKAGHDRFALFEINKAHGKTQLDDDGLPAEFDSVAVVVAADDKAKPAGAPFYWARTYLDQLAKGLGIGLRYEPLTEPPVHPAAQPYDYTRSARVYLGAQDIVLGLVGEFRSGVRRGLKLPTHAAGFELSLTPRLYGAGGQSYRQFSRYPSVQQDMSLRVPATVNFGQLYDFLQQNLEVPKHTTHRMTPLDIYQRPDDTEHKQYAFRLNIASFAKTMTDPEVNTILDRLAAKAGQAFGAERL